MNSNQTLAFGAASKDSPLTPMTIRRRDVGPKDVRIEVGYCGVCHSDLHKARDEWHSTTYPIVPGHEIVGHVTEVGSQVTKFKTGDVVGVGCMVDSCHSCDACREDNEPFCEKGATYTYNSPDLKSGGMTYGGYSKQIVVDQDFVLRIPKGLDPAEGAPLLCAGITTYAPMKQWNVGRGKKVGVVGIGGLGHVAVQIAHALDANVTAFTTSEEKAQEAKKFGADQAVLSKDTGAMAAQAETLDFIIDTLPVPHDLDPYLRTLKRHGVLVLVGLPDAPLSFSAKLIARNHLVLTGSQIGGIALTQEMLDFCAEHSVKPQIEMIRMDQINEAYDRLDKGNVHYRFVIDMATR